MKAMVPLPFCCSDRHQRPASALCSHEDDEHTSKKLKLRKEKSSEHQPHRRSGKVSELEAERVSKRHNDNDEDQAKEEGERGGARTARRAASGAPEGRVWQ